MKQKPRTTMVVIVSDLHCGSTVAVSPPEVLLDDGGFFRASKAQQWLWQNWLAFWAEVKAQRKASNARLMVVVNGDLTEGAHHGSTQVLSGNPAAQAVVVNEVLRIPLALNPDHWLFVRGTEAHVGPSAAYEERVASGLFKDGRPVIRDDATGTYSHWHAKVMIDGVRLDFAHHGRMGQRSWTKPNVVLNLAAEIFYEHAARNIPHPHIAVRSHQHRFVDTHDAHPTRVIQTPAWQLATAYIHRIAPGSIADVGGIIITVRDGRADVNPVIYHPDGPAEWRLP